MTNNKNLNLLSIEVENFKCFSSQQSFNFGHDIGTLNLVTGWNYAEPDLERNGVGKSTFFADALSFALFGKTLRGLKASNTATWQNSSKGSRVQLNFEEFTIIRHWNPNSLAIKEQKEERNISQEELEQKIGLTFESFANLFTVGQFSDKFLDLRPQEKMDIFASFLNLEKWVSASEKAKKQMQEIDSVIQKQQRELDRLQDRILNIENNVEQLQKQNENWEGEIAEQKQQMEEHISNSKETAGKLSEEIDELRKQLNSLSSEDDLYENINKSREKIEEVSVDINEINSDIRYYEEIFTDIHNKIGQFSRLEEEVPCPRCNQLVPAKHLQDELCFLEKEAGKNQKVLEELKEDHREFNKLLKKYKSSVQKQEEALREIQSSRRRLERSLSDREAKLGSEKENVESYRGQLDDLTHKSNPYEKQLSEAHSKLNEEKTKKSELEEKIKLSEAEKSDLDFWVFGFKQIRLLIVDRALRQFEIRVNNCLQELGLENWKIFFDIEKQGKTSTQKGFFAIIQSPYNDETVPWEAWSGGESQRLRLAGNMGLIDLIQDLTGTMPNIEIWDEGSAHMGPKGVNQFLEILQSRAEARNKQIWLIEHHALGYGGFERIVSVEKEGKNNSVIKEVQNVE